MQKSQRIVLGAVGVAVTLAVVGLIIYLATRPQHVPKRATETSAFAATTGCCAGYMAALTQLATS